MGTLVPYKGNGSFLAGNGGLDGCSFSPQPLGRNGSCNRFLPLRLDIADRYLVFSPQLVYVAVLPQDVLYRSVE